MNAPKRTSALIAVAAAALLAFGQVPVAFAADENPETIPQSASEQATPTAGEAALATADSAADVAQVTAPDGTVTSYPSLPEAVAAAPAGSTVTLLADVSLPAQSGASNRPVLQLDHGITLDGAGHTLTVGARGIYLFGGDSAEDTEAYTFKNITITDPDAFGRALSLRDGYKSLKLEDAVITTTGTGNTQVLTVGGNTPQTTSIDIVASTLAATGAGYGIITFNPVDITIADSDVSGYAALYMKGPDSSAGSSNSTVTVSDGSKLSSHGFVGPDDAFGTIVFQDSHNIKVNVTNSTVTADGSNGASQAVVKSTPYTSTDTPAQNNEVTFDEGSNVNATGTNSALVASNGQKNVVHAEDGTYHLDGATVVDGDGQPAPSDNLVVTGGHWNRSVADYVPAGYREQRRGGDTSDTPYAIGTTTEQPATPDEPDKPGTTPGETDNPDSPSTPDGSGAAGDPDDAATHQGGDNTDTDAEGEGAGDGGTEDGQHASGTPAASGSAAHATGNSTPSYRSTSSGQANRYAAIPQTGDTNPLSTLALGIAAASLLAMGAVTIRRHRTAGER